jgi:hypothetical protein
MHIVRMLGASSIAYKAAPATDPFCSPTSHHCPCSKQSAAAREHDQHITARAAGTETHFKEYEISTQHLAGGSAHAGSSNGPCVWVGHQLQDCRPPPQSNWAACLAVAPPTGRPSTCQQHAAIQLATPGGFADKPTPDTAQPSIAISAKEQQFLVIKGTMCTRH